MAATGVEQRVHQQSAGLWRTGRQRSQVHAIARCHAHADHGGGQLVCPQRRHDSAMAEHCALGAARGATGEQHHGGRIRLRQHTRQAVRYWRGRLFAKRCLGIETRPAGRQWVRRIFNGHTPHTGQALVHGTQAQSTPRVRHDQPTMRTGQAMVHLVRRPAAIHQHRDSAQCRDRDERHQPVRAVGERQPDEFAGLQAFYSTQVLGQPRGPSEHLYIRNPLIPEHGQHFAVVYARRRVEFCQ